MKSSNNSTEQLFKKIDNLEKELKKERDVNREYLEKAKTVYDLIYESGDIEDRAVLDDLQLLRELYVRFKSFRFILGLIFGALAVVVPVGLGAFKLVELIGTYINSK